MIFGASVAIVSAWLLGIVCTTALWPLRPLRRGELLMILSLGMGAGLGVTSTLFSAASFVSDTATTTYTLELLLGASAAWLAWSRRRHLKPGTPAPQSHNRLLSLLVGTVFTQACLVAALVAARAFGAEPFGSSDGWTLWNMHARVLYLGGENWAEILRAPQLGWTHPDYPLLVPASVARAWRYAGQDSPVVSGAVSGMFGLATLGLLVAGVSYLRSRTVALVGGVLLLGTPFFVTFSTNQHADIPLGFYILATLVLIACSADEPGAWRMAALAGASAGFAAWTKNEGLMFAAVVSVVCLVRGLVFRSCLQPCHCEERRHAATKQSSWVATVRSAPCDDKPGLKTWLGTRRTTAAFFTGLAVTLVPVVYFKLAIAPPNDVVASDPWTRLHSMMDWSRHRLIIQSLWRDLGRFGEWSTMPFLAMLLPLIGGGWKKINAREWMVAVVLVLMLGGYYSVYLLTHMDLAFHLDSSLVRLLLQLWPSAVFFWCLAVSYDPARPLFGSSHAVEPRLYSGTESCERQRELPSTRMGSLAPMFSGLGSSRTTFNAWTRPRVVTAIPARSKGVFIAINVALAAVVLTALGRQLPADQFARNRINGATAALFAGEGWFGMERHENDRWAWSTGESMLRLELNSEPTGPVTLQFSMRALGNRTVTATMGNRVIWQALVGEESQVVEVRGLGLQQGTTRIVFQTDSPGLPESSAPNARKLTFALYNPTIISH